MQQSEEARMAGLSPLARVTLAHLTDDNARLRFIPAGVGNTARWLPTTGQPSVYPRWRGEHVLIAVVTVGICGLSPLARGTLLPVCSVGGRGRFIPAGAGNTTSESTGKRSSPVYPRWRGEHAQASINSRAMSGLSPLARGTREPKIFALWDCRFIPAGAGNTDFDVEKIRTSAVYPRWRGEHITRITRGFRTCGLSPLARGTHLFPHPVIYLQRFIPAGAGNTRKETHRRPPRSVYPRWRREHSMTNNQLTSTHGLSPLARGTQIEIDQQIRSARFIPAGAGNTHPDLPERVKAAVYPRWRGEHGDLLNLPPGINGLSPLARGTRGEFSRNARLSRFIPAGAGNTKN